MASIPPLFCRRRRVTQEKDSQIHKTYSQIVKSVFRKDDLSYLHIMKIRKENQGGQIMKKTEKKELKELSEEQLKEVTGGAFPTTIKVKVPKGQCLSIICPSNNYDSQCNCIG